MKLNGFKRRNYKKSVPVYSLQEVKNFIKLEKLQLK